MKSKLQLSIQAPCSEKWDGFAMVRGGAFCGSCRKTVIDFTRMTEVEVIDFFKNKPTSVCGRFHPEQLKTYSELSPMRINPGLTYLKAGFLSLLLVLAGKQVSAQKMRDGIKVETVWDASGQSVKTDTTAKRHFVRGKVRDKENEEAVPGVNIYLKGSTEYTVTDYEGRFQFPKRLEPGDVLEFSFIGYKTKDFVVSNKIEEGLEIQLDLCLDIMMLGEVMVDGPYTSRSTLGTWWTRFKRKF